MKIASIKKVGRKPVYDLSVKEAQHYILENGVVTHNTGIYYSADTIWILGRQQDKDSKGINGYHFVINIEKSRYVKEKAKIPISISWEGGINRWSGLLEVAVEHGSVIKTKPGKYASADDPEKEFVEKKLIADKQFWMERLQSTDLAAFIEKKYRNPQAPILESD